jgi:hypothetical protein
MIRTAIHAKKHLFVPKNSCSLPPSDTVEAALFCWQAGMSMPEMTIAIPPERFSQPQADAF